MIALHEKYDAAAAEEIALEEAAFAFFSEARQRKRDEQRQNLYGTDE